MRKWSAIFFSILLVLSLSACGQADKDNETGNRNSQVSAEKNKNNTGSTSSNTRVLIAYFTVPEDVKTSDNDAIAGASIVVKDSEKMLRDWYRKQSVETCSRLKQKMPTHWNMIRW